MALFGALLLIFTLFIRPQEFIPGLDKVGLLNIAVGLGFIGVLIQFGTGKVKSAYSPQLPILAMFLGWCCICTLIKVGFGPVMDMKGSLGFSVIFMFLIMYAGRTFTNFRGLAVLLVFISIMLSAITIHQGQGEFQCILLDVEEDGSASHDRANGKSDGRSCEDSHWCDDKENGGDPSREYECERSGLFGSFTVAHGRVRWRGTLADPNELSLAVGAAMSFCFAIHASMRSKARHLILATVVGMVVYCVMLSGSRGGQLVLLIIFGVYFVRRYGAKGLLAGAVAGAPILLLGGRSGEDADSSSLERLEALKEGMLFFTSSPIFGLGAGQFVENYFITAHNSYLLAAAELGFPGMLLWSLLVYVSVKIPFIIGLKPPPDLDPRLPPYGLALLVSFCGILVGIFFLSFIYQNLLFIYFGMSGALFGVARQGLPRFNVKLTGKEIGIVAGLDALILAWLFVYPRLKGV